MQGQFFPAVCRRVAHVQAGDRRPTRRLAASVARRQADSRGAESRLWVSRQSPVMQLRRGARDRACRSWSILLAAVDELHVHRLVVLEPANDPPAAGNHDAPVAATAISLRERRSATMPSSAASSSFPLNRVSIQFRWRHIGCGGRGGRTPAAPSPDQLGSCAGSDREIRVCRCRVADRDGSRSGGRSRSPPVSNEPWVLPPFVDAPSLACVRTRSALRSANCRAIHARCDVLELREAFTPPAPRDQRPRVPSGSRAAVPPQEEALAAQGEPSRSHRLAAPRERLSCPRSA